ncbi:MAG: hypothetical protein QOJ66_1168 [Ilumatobacteraceae bacterium]
MDSLLEKVLDAHGGLENWASATNLVAHLSLGGPFWAARGWPDVYADQTVVLDPQREHITFTPFTASDRTSVFDVGPERVAIETAEGRVIDERNDPRASFPTNYEFATTRWDSIQVAYFASAAVWNYLTHPFGLTFAGVESREIEPWAEAGQTWRRLSVTFPQTNANHNAGQVFYYDERFMQRRMDYSPDVTGNPLIAHYMYDEKTFDGFVFPTRRLVHRRNSEGIADQTFAPITLDVHSVSIETACEAERVLRRPLHVRC